MPKLKIKKSKFVRGFTPTPILKSGRKIVEDGSGPFRSRTLQSNLLGIGVSPAKAGRGFTLVETLVAVFILAMAITSAMTVAQSGLRATFYARDRIAAYFLAQEAIEMIKNKRDENGIKNYTEHTQGGGVEVHWLRDIVNWDGLGGPCGQNSDCGPDSLRNIIIDCDLFNGCLLYQDSVTGIFQYVSNGSVPGTMSVTKFSRTVSMLEINDDEAKVTVTVSWPGRDFVVEEFIRNWHPLSECLECL